MVFLATPIVVQQNFQKNRPLANGIALCGLSVGNIIGPFWVDHLLEEYGWRGCFLMHGGLMLQATVLATQYRTPATFRPSKRQGGRSTTDIFVLDVSLGRNPSFVFFGIGIFLMRMAHYGGIMVFPNTLISYGVSLAETTLILTLCNFVVLISRVGWGFLANLKCANRVVFLGVALAIGGVGLILVAFSQDFEALLLCGCLIGFSVGGSVMLVYASLVDIVGLARIPQSTALAFAFQGTGALVAPPVAGGLYDVTADYQATYFFVGIGSVIGGLSVFTVAFLERTKRKESRLLEMSEKMHQTSKSKAQCDKMVEESRETNT